MNLIKRIFKQLPPPQTPAQVHNIKSGTVMIDKMFGGKWCRIQIVEIGANGDSVLYRYSIAGGKAATTGDLYTSTISFLLAQEYVVLHN